MNIQHITDAQSQKPAVVIPIKEYEKLMEDVSDLACFAERSDDELIPLSEVQKGLIADGLQP